MTDEQEFTQVIGRALPYDGPHTPETVQDAAAGISALVRYLNNATSKRGTFDYVSDIYPVLTALEAAAYGLDQLLIQLGEKFTEYSDDPAMYDDRDKDNRHAAELTATEAAAGCAQARRGAFELREALSNAAGAAGHLGQNVTGRQR